LVFPPSPHLQLDWTLRSHTVTFPTPWVPTVGWIGLVAHTHTHIPCPLLHTAHPVLPLPGLDLVRIALVGLPMPPFGFLPCCAPWITLDCHVPLAQLPVGLLPHTPWTLQVGPLAVGHIPLPLQFDIYMVTFGFFIYTHWITPRLPTHLLFGLVGWIYGCGLFAVARFGLGYFAPVAFTLLRVALPRFARYPRIAPLRSLRWLPTRLRLRVVLRILLI